MTTQAAEIAAAVLAKASCLDQTFAQPDPAIHSAWTEQMQSFYGTIGDALDAVRDHYRAETRRIMPADVLRRAPTTAESVEAWVSEMVALGKAGAVAHRADLAFPTIDNRYPGSDEQGLRAYMVGHAGAWVIENRDEIVARIVARETGRRASQSSLRA